MTLDLTGLRQVGGTDTESAPTPASGLDFTGLKAVGSVDLSGLKAVGPALGIDQSAAQPIAAPDNSGGGFFHEAGAAFKRSILSQNPQSLADSLEMGSVLTRQDAPPTLADGVLKLAGRITDPIGAVADDLGALTGIHASDVMKGASDTVRSWAKAGDDGSKPSVPTLGDIHNMSDAVSYVGSAIGNAAGSSAPSLVAGTAVAAATKNPVAGFFAGAFGPSYIQNSGDTYATLRDNPGVQQAIKDGKITDKQVAGWAAAASVPIAALDAYGAEKMLPIQKLKGEIVSRVLKRILIGGATEGGTEGFQQVLQEATLAAAGGDHTLADAAMNVIESTVQGTIGGTAVSAVTEPLSKEQPSAQAGAGVAEGAAAPTVTEGAGVSPPPSAPSRDSERLDSPRLTAADRASPLPNDLIDEGKKVFESALGKKAIDVPTSDIATPAMRAEAERRAADIATPASQAAAPAIEHTIDGTLTPAEAASAPGAAPARLLSDAEFMGGASTVDEAAHAAATSPQNALPEPTQAMKEAGNYKVGHTMVGGLDVSIENPQGSTRSGVDPNGKPWTQEMQSHYGYIKGTVGKDKDHVDVFVKPGTPSEMADDAPVFVVDQKNDKGSFDEHKILMGFADQAEADAGYHANYQKGWKGAGAITQTTLGEFKGWLANGDTTKPFGALPKSTQNMRENIPEPAAQTALKQKIKAKRELAPSDLVQFLAGNGGIRDHKGEITSLGMKNHFVPGRGKLMREGGMSLDRAREMAEEAGYIGKAGDYQTTTVADLLDALDKNMRGQRVYAREDAGRAENRAAEKAVKTDSEEQARRDDFDQMVKEFDLNDAETKQIQAAVERGEWASEAIGDILERRAIVSESKTRKSRTQKEPSVDDIPFDIGPAPKAGESAADESSGRKGPDAGRAERPAPAVEQPAEAERAGRAEEGGKGQSALAEEAGADNKPQTIIPGAERISKKKQAQREADKPMRPKVPQKDAGELFDGQARSEKQDDLPFFKAQAQAIGKRLRAELDRLGLKDIGLRIQEQLGMMVDGRMHAADGQYFQKLITIALDAENPDATLAHEAIHALRELSLFGKDEWAILERQSRKKWMAEHKIAEAYGAFPEWVQVEEGIAHAYGEWSRQGSGFDGIIVKAFRKIKAVLRAIARAFGKDFTSIEDVFAKIDSGEVGSRPGNVQMSPAPPMFQAGWHGTPHDFNEFSSDKIGTGEGAQAFGYGLYFAGKREIAEFYRKGLSAKDTVRNFREALPDDADFDDVMALVGKGHFTPYQERVLNALQADDWLGFDYPSQAISAAYSSKLVDNYDPSPELVAAVQSSGKLFKVDLPEDSELMDWDKPLKDQPEAVQNILDDAMRAHMPVRNIEEIEKDWDTLNGWEFYETLSHAMGEKAGTMNLGWTSTDPVPKNDRMASEALRAAGIPGHRYLDNTSRDKGEGTYNYVIYDDSRVKVQEKFALRRAAAAPAQRRTTPPVSILPNISTLASSVSTRIMNAIKGGPGKNDGETIRGYSARKITDYLDPLKRMIDSAGPAVTDATNAYQEARLAMDAGIAAIQEMHRDFVTPSILALHRVGATLDELHRYLYALHTEERNRVVGLRNDPKSDFYKAASDPSIVGASGWSTNQAVRELQKLRSDLKKYVGIREAGRLYRQMLDENLLAQKNAGLISDASYNSLTQQWKNYVPLHADEGVDENGDFQMPGRGRGFDVRGKEFKGATGRFSEAENIPGWAIATAERSKLRQAKEPVGQALLRFIAQFDPMGTKFADVFWAESSPPAPGGIQKAPTVYKRELDKSGMVVSKAVPYSTISPEMYATKIAGKAYYIQFTDTKVGAALKNMNALQLNLALRVLRMGTNLVSLVNTRLNPEFVYRNFFRDALTALVHLTGFNTKETAKVYSDIPSAWAAVWKAQRGHPGTGPMDQALAELTKTGGRIIFEQQKTVEDSIASLHAQMKAAAAGTLSPQRAWESVKKFVGDINDTVEMGMRLAAYKGMRAKGKTAKQASLGIRDLTVDFRKHGEFGPTGNAFYAFFNASVQGSVNVIKNLATSRRAQKFAGGLVLSGFVMGMLNRSLSGDDDDGENIYDKMLREEPWKFERQMILFYGPGKNSYFTIPLAYGYNVFAYMGLQADAAGHGNISGIEAISNTLRVGFDAYNPIGGSGDFLTMLLPTGLTPFWEVKTNKNFADIPIYPNQQHGDTTPDSHMQQFTKTPGAYRFLAEQLNDWTGGNKIESGAIDVHPESIKHIADFVTGGLGRFFMGVEDPIQKAVTGHAGDIDVGQLPFVRTMYGQWSDQSRKSEYYKLREAVGAADDQNEKYKDSKGDKALDADFETFKAEHKVEIDSISAFDVAEKRLGKLRKQQRRLEAEGGHEAELKSNAEAQKKAMDKARKEFADNAATAAKQR